jgi:uncharacterized protein (DUF342 family)
MVDILVEIMSPAEKKFFEIYRSVHWNRSKAGEVMGYRNDSWFLKKPVVKKAIEISQQLEVMGEQAVSKVRLPTLEYTLTQLTDLLDDVVVEYDQLKKEIEGEKDPSIKLMLREKLVDLRAEKGKYLKQLSDFHAKFGEMIDNEKLAYGKMTLVNLILYIKDKFEWFHRNIRKAEWYETPKTE